MIDRSKYILERKIIRFVKSKTSDYWEYYANKSKILFFYKVAKLVPAYKDFLKKRVIRFEDIKGINDFSKIPQIDKNYLRSYELKDLCWFGKLSLNTNSFSSTSGSTGEPFYFPRSRKIDWQYSFIFEDFIKQNIAKSTERVLIVISFAMGSWIAGQITYNACEILSRRNSNKVSIITPGIDKTQILEAVKNLSPYFDKIILVGYPPFVKDIIDELENNIKNFTNINFIFLFAAESIGQDFKNYLVNKVGLNNPLLNISNIYGSAEMGAMAFEGPLCSLIKSILHKNKIKNNIFTFDDRLPTIAQYNPLFINFESYNGKILLTGNNTIPLVRYSIGDIGGNIDFNTMITKLATEKIDLIEECRRSKIQRFCNELPFVFINEREDFSVSFYGINIYPDIIRSEIFREPLSNYLSGKFILSVEKSVNMDPYLYIKLEKKQYRNDLDVTIQKKINQTLIEKIKKDSSEFRALSSTIKNRTFVKISYFNFEDEIFKVVRKHKWVKQKTNLL